MGYRAHYATEYKVQWGGGFFSHHTENFDEMVTEEMPDSYQYEDESKYDLVPAEVAEYITKLLKEPTATNKYFDYCTNEDVAEALQDMLDNYDKSNDRIIIEWF